MSFLNNRLKRIEKTISPPEMWFGKLLSPEYKYTGKPFDSFDKMVNHFNIIEQVCYWETSMLVTLIQKGIMSIDSDVGKELLKIAADEIKIRL